MSDHRMPQRKFTGRSIESSQSVFAPSNQKSLSTSPTQTAEASDVQRSIEQTQASQVTQPQFIGHDFSQIPLLPHLTVSQPAEPTEQSDRASQIMRSPNAGTVNSIPTARLPGHDFSKVSVLPQVRPARSLFPPDVQRKCEVCKDDEKLTRSQSPMPLHLMRQDDGNSQPTDSQDADAIPMGPSASNSTTNFSVTNKTRPVSGKTLSQAWDSMTNSGTKESASVTPELKPDPQYEYDEDKVAKVTVNVRETKEMPQWVELDQQCPPIKSEWNRFYSVLDQHEEKHIAIDRKHFTNVHQKLVGKPRQTAWDTLDKVVDTADKENIAYDASSNHGVTEGAKINAAVQCGVEKLTESGTSSLDTDSVSDIPSPDTTMLMAKSSIVNRTDQSSFLEPTASDAIAQRIQAASGSGSTLDEGVQQHLEQHLGADLSSVRIHTDGEADQLSRSVNAIAFTTGQDIFFSAGSYNPASTEGQHLIAHEVVHTVQQATGAVAGTPTVGGVSISNPSDPVEQEAERIADQVIQTPNPHLLNQQIGQTLGTPKDRFKPLARIFQQRVHRQKGHEDDALVAQESATGLIADQFSSKTESANDQLIKAKSRETAPDRVQRRATDEIVIQRLSVDDVFSYFRTGNAIGDFIVGVGAGIVEWVVNLVKGLIDLAAGLLELLAEADRGSISANLGVLGLIVLIALACAFPEVSVPILVGVGIAVGALHLAYHIAMLFNPLLTAYSTLR